MADAIISFLLVQLKTTIVDKLGQLKTTIVNKAAEEVGLLVGIEKEVRKLERNLDLINTVLRDAEKKKRTNGLVKEWLDRLKEASYDMGDALDEWRTTVEIEARKSQNPAPWESQNAACRTTGRTTGRTTLVVIEARESQNAAPWKKARCSFFPSFPLDCVSTRRRIALNIKEINQRLDDIVREKNNYQLESTLTSNTMNQPQQRPESSSFVDVSKLRGREKEKAEILNYLWGRSGEEEAGELIPTLSIVGMGGLGKTALAQLICSDDDVKRYFDRVIWVCVSDLFYEKKVAMAIIHGLEKLSGSAAYGLELAPLDVLLKRISESIHGMKYLLVLDDVWDGNQGERWEGLKTTFKLGAPGSRILVTTRDVEVAKMMGSSSSQIISLEKLGDEQCWSIIKHIALGGRDDQNLEKIGREIAEKCKGLPLVAKTLGSLLKSKRSKRGWQSVLNSEIWELELAEKEIFAPLLLSYYELPPPVKQCFVYCVLFPKDLNIMPHVLIPQWMAMGYLGSDGNADLESKGEEYFHILVERSFFQDFTMLEGEIICCKMHDIVHDFAQYLAENEFVTKEINSDHLTIDGSKNRHLTVMIDRGMRFPTSISGVEKLRALTTSTGAAALTYRALDSLFHHCKRLRVLSFSWPHGNSHHLFREIPEGIGKLIHLRFFYLRNCFELESLPEALCNLLNLECLDLKLCENLKQLPDSIGKLINLRYLDTFGCTRLTHYPEGVRKLTSLRRLSGLIVTADRNDAKEFSLIDLENLKHLHLLHLIVEGNSIDMEQARKAQLQDTQWLSIILTGSIQRADIIEALDPHRNIPHLRFDNPWIL